VVKENSGAIELYGEEGFSTTRHRLYQAATKLYEQKEFIEKEPAQYTPVYLANAAKSSSTA